MSATDETARQARRLSGRSRPMRAVYDKAVLHDAFSTKARVVQRGARIVVQPVMRLLPFNDRTIRAMQRFDQASKRTVPSSHVDAEEVYLDGVHAESMHDRRGPASDLRVLYLHGGGFFSCGIDTHRRICEVLSQLTGATVTSVEYVQLPDGDVADSVRDAITAYAALVERAEHPDRVVVAGDSAGGYLTMKVAELATRRGLPRPAALLAFSPLLSLDPENEDKAVERIEAVHDAYLPPSRVPMVRERWLPEGRMIEGFAAPLHATDYIDSPTFITVTEDEMLRPEAEAMALLLAERGVPVELHIWRKQVHAFPVMADTLPESREALRLAADFARRAVGEPGVVTGLEDEVLEEGRVEDVADEADDALSR